MRSPIKKNPLSAARSVLHGRTVSISMMRIGVVTVFAIAGYLTLSLSHAATPAASVEAESGTLSGNASVISDPSTSNGSAVKFSPNSTTIPTSGNWPGESGNPVGYAAYGDVSPSAFRSAALLS